jgi:hypothetical protein
MSFQVTTVTTISGKRVEPGATWTRPAQGATLSIQIQCERNNPNVFTGAVLVGNREVKRTDECDSYERAEAAANTLVKDAYARLFA